MEPSIPSLGDDIRANYYIPRRSSDLITFAVHVVLQFVVLDIILFSFIIPLVGMFVGDCLSDTLELSLKWEVVADVTATTALMFGAFVLIARSSYWKPIVLGDFYYTALLQARDIINTIASVWWILQLVETVQNILIGKNTESYLGGTLESIALSVGILVEHELVDDTQMQDLLHYQYAFKTYWAQITVCMAKLVYFNTLFTYLRCMETFLTLKPNFEERNSIHELGSFTSDTGSFSGDARN